MTQEEFLALQAELEQEKKSGPSSPRRSQQNREAPGLGGYFNNLGERAIYGARFGEAKINYLKKKYGESNVQVGSDNEPLVRRNGEWVRFNPKGLDVGDFAEFIPDAALGLGLGALTGGGSAAVQGGKAVAQAAPTLWSTLGKVAALGAGESIVKQAVTSPLAGAVFGGQEEGFTRNRVVDPLVNAGLGAGTVGAANLLGSGKRLVKNSLIKRVTKAAGEISPEGQKALDIASKYNLPPPTLGQTASEPGVLAFEDYLKSTPTGRGAFDTLQQKTTSSIQKVADNLVPQGSTVEEAGKSAVATAQQAVKSARESVREINKKNIEIFDAMPGVHENSIDASSLRNFADEIALNQGSGQSGKTFDNIVKKIYLSLHLPETVTKDGVISPKQLTNVMTDINAILKPAKSIELTESQKAAKATIGEARLQEVKTRLFQIAEDAAKTNPAAQEALNIMKGYKDIYEPLNAAQKSLVNTLTNKGKKPENVVNLLFSSGPKTDPRDVVKKIGGVMSFLSEKGDTDSIKKIQMASMQRIFDASKNKGVLTLPKLNTQIKDRFDELQALYSNNPESQQALRDLSDYLDIATKGAGFGNSATATRQGFLGALTGAFMAAVSIAKGDQAKFVFELGRIKGINKFNETLSQVLTDRKAALKFSEVLRQNMQSFSPKTPQRISVGGRALGKLGLEYLGDKNQ